MNSLKTPRRSKIQSHNHLCNIGNQRPKGNFPQSESFREKKKIAETWPPCCRGFSRQWEISVVVPHDDQRGRYRFLGALSPQHFIQSTVTFINEWRWHHHRRRLFLIFF
ncbi:hypothetical protein NPIL_100181 [Nephila pilipes]|uniref:Uncharacterized protein n=1 Tax=Nephila pilipes TaxID=299642 RepID=A0A8X6NSP7_NEPPI|nr:hypothetical protein NPIL_100181 [Nephila pilipes]